MVMTPTLQNPDVTAKGNAAGVPFRRATLERVDILPPTAITLSAGANRQESTVEGSGYLYGIMMRAVVSSSGNSANVALQEDAPWSLFDTVVLRDVNGELLNLSGYDLFIANLVCKQYASGFPGNTFGVTPNTYIFSAPTTGMGGTAGSTTFMLRVPVGLNRRDLIAILGNQDRAQKYFLRTDFSPNSLVYSTPPNGTVAVNVEEYYENYAVPMPTTPQGNPQEVYPPAFGTLHFLTSTLAEAAPLGGSTVSHYLRRLGNTIRWIALVFRANGSRATAEANRPTSIRFKIGEDTIFNETYEYRRELMLERFGITFPDGVLVYDAMHDFAPSAGNELGDDYYHTQAVVNAMFQISYPVGYGSTNNSLKIITDDLQRVGAPIR